MSISNKSLHFYLPKLGMPFDKLIHTFLEVNSHLNLSAIRDYAWVEQKHVMDALEIQNIFPLKDGLKVCDIGTWGGFPLLPLAMNYPKVNFVGIDSTRKKIDAVNGMIKELGIKNAKAIRTRIEEYQEQFDVITARAVGYIDKILEWSYHLLKKGWHFVLYKQASEEEKTDLMKLCKLESLTLVHEHLYKLFPEDIQRVIYVIRKN